MPGVEVVELESAYVLHRRPYRDSSAIIELLTADKGRVGVVARGVRGQRSRQAGLLQPFQPLRVSWRARGDLGTLTGAEAASGPLGLAGRRMVAGFYANELMLRLLVRHQPHTMTFASYAALLGQLANGAAIGPSLRVFERDLLTDLGYGLALTTDALGETVQADGWYRYELQKGLVPVGGEGVGRCVLGESLLALARGEPRPVDDQALKRVTSLALRPYLGDAPLKSRELYARYRDSGSAAREDANDE